jgi:predicted RNA methylase
VFLDYLPENTLAYDLYPDDSRIIKQDYLEVDIEYKRGRLVIGNPPFGFMTKKAIQFYNKSVELGDYISFIMPYSYLDNTKQVYKFNLVHSEDLGNIKFVDRDIHVCLNIYKRPANGLNKQNVTRYKSDKYIKITEVRKQSKIATDFDYAICSWGSVGKEIVNANSGEFAKEFYIEILNDDNYDKVYDLLKNTDWIEQYDMVGTPNLLQWQVYKYIDEQMLVD